MNLSLPTPSAIEPPDDQLFLPFRFAVFFFAGGLLPNPVDIRFQRVGGLGSRVETTPWNEGGENLYQQRLPTRIGYENLVLERGLMPDSVLNLEVATVMSLFRFHPSNLLVTLLDDHQATIAAWFFTRAFPVAWKTSDLDANARDRVMIETLELSYARMHSVSL